MSVYPTITARVEWTNIYDTEHPCEEQVAEANRRNDYCMDLYEYYEDIDGEEDEVDWDAVHRNNKEYLIRFIGSEKLQSMMHDK